MSVRKFVLAATLVTFATIGWSQTSPEDHAAHHSSDKPQSTVPAAAKPDHQMMDSKDDIASLRALIDRAEHAKTAAERERLLDEHLAAMRKQLDSLRSQSCSMERMDVATAGGEPGAKPGMMGDGMKMGEGSKGDHTMMCHQMMKARVEVMTELLEQTWRREELRKGGVK